MNRWINMMEENHEKNNQKVEKLKIDIQKKGENREKQLNQTKKKMQNHFRKVIIDLFIIGQDSVLESSVDNQIGEIEVD